VSFNGVIRGREIIPVNRDEPVGSEVGIPFVLDCSLHHLPEGFGFGIDLTEFSVEGGLGVLMWFRSWFGLIPSFHSGMFLTLFGTYSCLCHKYCSGNGSESFETL
jgi:hypothetical protein